MRKVIEVAKANGAGRPSPEREKAYLALENFDGSDPETFPNFADDFDLALANAALQKQVHQLKKQLSNQPPAPAAGHGGEDRDGAKASKGKGKGKKGKGKGKCWEGERQPDACLFCDSIKCPNKTNGKECINSNRENLSCELCNGPNHTWWACWKHRPWIQKRIDEFKENQRSKPKAKSKAKAKANAATLGHTPEEGSDFIDGLTEGSRSGSVSSLSSDADQ